MQLGWLGEAHSCQLSQPPRARQAGAGQFRGRCRRAHESRYKRHWHHRHPLNTVDEPVRRRRCSWRVFTPTRREIAIMMHSTGTSLLTCLSSVTRPEISFAQHATTRLLYCIYDKPLPCPLSRTEVRYASNTRFINCYRTV